MGAVLLTGILYLYILVLAFTISIITGIKVRVAI